MPDRAFQPRAAHRQTVPRGWCLGLALAGLLLAPLAQSDPLPKPISGEVRATRLNIRARPGLQYEAVGQLQQGEKVTVVAVEGDWLGIAAPPNCAAWVAANLLVGHLVGAKSAPVYAGPNAVFSSYVTLAPGTPVKVLQTVDEKWSRISTPAHAILWVSRDFLTLERPLPAPPAAPPATPQAAVAAPPSTPVAPPPVSPPASRSPSPPAATDGKPAANEPAPTPIAPPREVPPRQRQVPVIATLPANSATQTAKPTATPPGTPAATRAPAERPQAQTPALDPALVPPPLPDAFLDPRSGAPPPLAAPPPLTPANPRDPALPGAPIPRAPMLDPSRLLRLAEHLQRIGGAISPPPNRALRIQTLSDGPVSDTLREIGEGREVARHGIVVQLEGKDAVRTYALALQVEDVLLPIVYLDKSHPGLAAALWQPVRLRGTLTWVRDWPRPLLRVTELVPVAPTP